MLDTKIDAGRITRFHTVPTIQQDTVATHTFNMMLIADEAFDGDPPKDLILGILCHDLHEILTGDIPYYTKKHNKEIFGQLEEDANKTLGINKPLSIESWRILKIIDMLEAMTFAVRERMLGNVGIADVFCATLKELDGRIEPKDSTVYANLSRIMFDHIDKWEEITKPGK